MKKSDHLTKKKMTVLLGEVLREARLKAELTQADVAERVGVATEVYGRIERGNLTPSVPNLRKLCMVLRVDASAALGLDVREAAAWLQESAALPEESPRLRRLLRTLRQLDDKQLNAVSYMVRSLVTPEAR
jgi:transcriptional regulator with XRE-family HTH domain